MKFLSKQWLRQNWAAITGVFTVAVIGTTLTLLSRAAAVNTTVNFNTTVTTMTNKPFSGSLSTFGESNGSIDKSAKQRTALGNLGAGYYRVPLQWNGGNIRTSAGGNGSQTSGDTWVNSIKSFGGQPQIVLGGTADNNFTPDDAANMVRHFNKPAGGNANRVDVWVIGNEPNNPGVSHMEIDAYCNFFNSIVDSMKAVDPTIKVAGPAWSEYKNDVLRTFLNCAGDKVDIIDYHHYAMGGELFSTADALSQTRKWEQEVLDTRTAINQIKPGRSAQIEIQVGEFNWAWKTDDGYQGYQGDDRFYQAINTVWGASVAGHIAKGGGRGHQYSDQNGALGITFEKDADAAHFGRAINDPMPIYYGQLMFTGGNLFRGFGGRMVDATTTLPNTEVFASGNNKNVVMINKDPNATQTASLKLTGFTSGSVEIWQTNKDAPFNAPVKKATANIGDTVEYSLPPYSVTTFVFTDGATAPTPTPTPTPTPAPGNSEIPLRINVGGAQYTDPSGNVWKADIGYNGGNTDNQAAGRAIAKTTMAGLYQDERWGTFSYKLPISNGTYKLRLHFAEIYDGCKVAGCRVFNATAEGAAWLTNYDIVAKTGANSAIVEEKAITINDGALDINLTGVTGSAQLTGIEVLAADTPAPAPAPTPTPTPTPAPSARGLKATYFANMTLSGTPVSRTDANIDFNWGQGAPLQGIPADKFSTRWTGAITPATSANYTFYLTGDDGVRMWIDGKQIINGWADQSSKEYQASISLVAGKAYDIKVEYYDNGWDAVVKLAWSTPSMAKQTVPTSVLSTGVARTGLTATYYQYMGLGPAILSTIDPNIDYNWGAGSPAGVPADQFGATWTGYITVPAAGQYTFTTESDDGVRLFVDNQTLIDNWTDHAPTQKSATINLNANQAYPIKVQYYENGGGAVMRLLWKTPGQTNAVPVPNSALST